MFVFDFSKSSEVVAPSINQANDATQPQSVDHVEISKNDDELHETAKLDETLTDSEKAVKPVVVEQKENSKTSKEVNSKIASKSEKTEAGNTPKTVPKDDVESSAVENPEILSPGSDLQKVKKRTKRSEKKRKKKKQSKRSKSGDFKHIGGIDSEEKASAKKESPKETAKTDEDGENLASLRKSLDAEEAEKLETIKRETLAKLQAEKESLEREEKKPDEVRTFLCQCFIVHCYHTTTVAVRPLPPASSVSYST